MPHIDEFGVTYPLSHLHPFRYQVILPPKYGRPTSRVDVHVGFAMHCFTRAPRPGDRPGNQYRDKREHRTFDSDRYALSKRLPHVARTLNERRCGFAKDDNYVTLDLGAADGTSRRYAVFFNVKRWVAQGPDAALLIVQSAYPLDPTKPEPGRGRIGFNALLGHALRGTRPKAP